MMVMSRFSWRSLCSSWLLYFISLGYLIFHQLHMVDAFALPKTSLFLRISRISPIPNNQLHISTLIGKRDRVQWENILPKSKIKLFSSLVDVSDKDEIKEYLAQSFMALANGVERLPFDRLCLWEEIESLINEYVVSKKELKKIFLKFTDSLTKGIDFDQFCEFNYELDRLLEPKLKKRPPRVQKEEEDYDDDGDLEEDDTEDSSSSRTKSNKLQNSDHVEAKQEGEQRRDPEEYEDNEDEDEEQEKEEENQSKSNFEKLFASKPTILQKKSRTKSSKARNHETDEYIDEYDDADTPFVTSPIRPVNPKGGHPFDPELDPDDDENDKMPAFDPAKVNVWDEKVPIESLYAEPLLEKLKKIFIHKTKHSSEENLLSYKDFFDWKEIKSMVDDYDLEETVLREHWVEAMEFERAVYGYNATLSEKSLSSSSMKDKNVSLPSLPEDNHLLDKKNKIPKDKDPADYSNVEKYQFVLKYSKNLENLFFINFDSFLRLYYKCKILKNSIQEVKTLSENNPREAPLIAAFKNITSVHLVYQDETHNPNMGEPIMTYEEFFRWEYIKFLLSRMQNNEQRKYFLNFVDSLWKRVELTKQVLMVPLVDREKEMAERKQREAELQALQAKGISLNSTESAKYKMKQLIDFKTIQGIDQTKFLWILRQIEKFFEGTLSVD
jgi:hypothetical protein